MFISCKRKVSKFALEVKNILRKMAMVVSPIKKELLSRYSFRCEGPPFGLLSLETLC